MFPKVVNKKMHYLFLASLLSIFFLPGFAQAESPNAPDYRIAFGSCAKDREPQPLWFDVLAQQPDIFLFIGDNQYADIQFDEFGYRVRGPVTDPAAFDSAYSRLMTHEGFAKLRDEVPILATWDDHDYGDNDAGKEFALKKQSQKAFMNFFNFPQDHPIRTQEGVYNAATIENQGKTIQFIILDTRYHRDPLDRNPDGRPEGKGPYIKTKDTSRTLLGDVQWKWLQDQLEQPADVRFIASSIQVVAYEHSWETWGNMPHERQRLYNLISETGANGVVFLSGDRHLMEVSKDDGSFDMSVPYPLWDFTSSGFNQQYREVNEENKYRIGKPVRDTHYATIDIHWAEPLLDTKIVFTALGLENKVFQTNSVRLSELQFSK